jgi:TetR/AcrR family transcriptional regulator, acrAB operon repressor
MARKTKEEAQATRGRILDAAERLFQAQGVSRTSLHDIAVAAGVTRGAVYWHFQDKGDLFNAMLERVFLPMELRKAALTSAAPGGVLPAVRELLVDILTLLERDEQARRVAEIVTQRLELSGEMSGVRERRLQVRRDFQHQLERALRQGQRSGEVRPSPGARQLALGLHALLDGLIHNWLFDPSHNLRRAGAHAIDVHLAGLARRFDASA